MTEPPSIQQTIQQMRGNPDQIGRFIQGKACRKQRKRKKKKQKLWTLFSSQKHASEILNKQEEIPNKLRRTSSLNFFNKKRQSSSSSPPINKPSRCRFRSLDTWKHLFEPKTNSANDGLFVDANGKPVLERWAIKRFFHYANFKLERKLLLGSLEKISEVLSLCEGQATKKGDDNMALLLNSLNGYILCLRFGAAKKNLKARFKGRSQKSPRRRQSSVSVGREDKANSVFSSGDEHASTLNNIKTAGINAFQSLRLTDDDLNRNRDLLLKGNKNDRLVSIQSEAIDGLYEAIVLFILEVKEEQKKQNGTEELDVEELSTRMMKKFKERLFSTMDQNQKFIASTLESIYAMNEVLFEPSVSNFLFISSIKNLVKAHWKEFMTYIKEATSALLDLVREEYLVKYLQSLVTMNVFSRKWMFDPTTGRLIFDEADEQSKQKMKEFLDSGYVQMEHYIFSLSHFSLRNLEKVILS